VLAASGSPADRFAHLLVGQRPMGMGASSELSPKIERNLLLEQSLPACAGPRFEGRHIDRIGRCTHATPPARRAQPGPVLMSRAKFGSRPFPRHTPTISDPQSAT
jgi:hypothetical protein